MYKQLRAYTYCKLFMFMHIAVVLLHHWLMAMQAVLLGAASAASLLLWQTILG